MKRLKTFKTAFALPMAAIFCFAVGCRPAAAGTQPAKVADTVVVVDKVVVDSRIDTVKTGIEVLRDSGFAILDGKRVGLVTNQSGVDRNLNSTIDILNDAPNVHLVALYGPEHGVRGNHSAGKHVKDDVDPSTGLPIFSLYGKKRRPTQEMLEGIDVLVYDIQDNGSRSYTFISTLGSIMEACADVGVEVVVLDRPNPLGGLKVEGSYVEPDCVSFIGRYPIPYIYGLTVGELATYLNEEGLLRGPKWEEEPHHCQLTVVPMEGWRRDMYFDDTHQPWVMPSAHIPEAKTSFYYPASGMVGELGGWMSIGIGYTVPFQLFGAQWVDSDQFADSLNALHLPGVRFRPITYKPYYASGKDSTLQGVQFFFTDLDAARLTEVQFYVMQVAAELYPDHLAFPEGRKYKMFDYATGSHGIREAFSKSYRVEDILPYWRKDEEAFREASSKYYLY